MMKLITTLLLTLSVVTFSSANNTTARPISTLAPSVPTRSIVSNTTSNETCNDLQSIQCINGGSCLEIQGRFMCVCFGPWTGTTCDTAFSASTQTPSVPTRSIISNTTSNASANNTTAQPLSTLADTTFETTAQTLATIADTTFETTAQPTPAIAQASSQAPSVPTRSIVSNTTSNETCNDLQSINGGSCLEIQGRFMCVCFGPWTGTTCDTAFSASTQTPSVPTRSIISNTTSNDVQQSRNIASRTPRRRRRFRQSGGSSSEEENWSSWS